MASVWVVHITSDDNYGIETVEGVYSSRFPAEVKFWELFTKHADRFHEVYEVTPWAGYFKMATDENDVTIAIREWEIE